MTESYTERLSSEALADFAQALASRFEVSEVLYRLAEYLVEVLEVDGAGVALVDGDGRLRSATGINQLATELDATEESLQEGPCVDACTHGAVVAVEDLSTMPESWPRWSPHARQRGVHAVLSVPLRTTDVSVGAVNIYSRQVRRWHDHEMRVARSFCDIAASYAAIRAEVEHSQRTAEQLQEALNSRVVVEQAKGVLASHYKVSVDDAFGLLRDHARRTNVTLRSVAHAVVHNGYRLPSQKSTRP